MLIGLVILTVTFFLMASVLHFKNVFYTKGLILESVSEKVVLKCDCSRPNRAIQSVCLDGVLF